MSTLTAMTDRKTKCPASPSPGAVVTRQQEQNVRHLPAGYEVVGILGRTPVVRRPDGQLSRMKTKGRLVKADGVQAVQSYLLVHG